MIDGLLHIICSNRHYYYITCIYITPFKQVNILLSKNWTKVGYSFEGQRIIIGYNDTSDITTVLAGPHGVVISGFYCNIHVIIRRLGPTACQMNILWNHILLS